MGDNTGAVYTGVGMVIIDGAAAVGMAAAGGTVAAATGAVECGEFSSRFCTVTVTDFIGVRIDGLNVPVVVVTGIKFGEKNEIELSNVGFIADCVLMRCSSELTEPAAAAAAELTIFGFDTLGGSHLIKPSPVSVVEESSPSVPLGLGLNPSPSNRWESICFLKFRVEEKLMPQTSQVGRG